MEGHDGTRILFHHSFAEWLLDVKHCTSRFLCSPADGHAMLALSFMAHAPELRPTEVHNYALHIARSGLFTESRSGGGVSIHEAFWLAVSGADIKDCLSGAVEDLPNDPAVIRLLIAAGANPPADERWNRDDPVEVKVQQDEDGGQQEDGGDDDKDNDVSVASCKTAETHEDSVVDAEVSDR